MPEYKHKAIEFDISGDMFTSRAVVISYKHTYRAEPWKTLDIIEPEDIGVKIVNTGKYGYRYFDIYTGRFISRRAVEKRIIQHAYDKISQEFSYDLAQSLEFEGELDSGGGVDFHGSY